MWGQPPSAVQERSSARCVEQKRDCAFRRRRRGSFVDLRALRGKSPLLLEQILKRRPRVIGPQTRRSRSLLLPRDPNLIKRALVPSVFLRDPLLHRLHALKPAPRIEICALLARMQFKPALRTLPIARRSLQHRTALRAARNRPRSRQINGPRTKAVVPLRRRSTRLLPQLLS